jgi:hypothetical protein
MLLFLLTFLNLLLPIYYLSLQQFCLLNLITLKYSHLLLQYHYILLNNVYISLITISQLIIKNSLKTLVLNWNDLLLTLLYIQLTITKDISLSYLILDLKFDLTSTFPKHYFLKNSIYYHYKTFLTTSIHSLRDSLMYTKNSLTIILTKTKSKSL